MFSFFLKAEVRSPNSLIRKVADVLLRLDPRPDNLRHLLDAPYEVDDVRRSTRDVLEVDPRRLEDRRERGFARRFELAKDGRNARGHYPVSLSVSMARPMEHLWNIRGMATGLYHSRRERVPLRLERDVLLELGGDLVPHTLLKLERRVLAILRRVEDHTRRFDLVEVGSTFHGPATRRINPTIISTVSIAPRRQNFLRTSSGQPIGLHLEAGSAQPGPRRDLLAPRISTTYQSRS